MFHVLIKLFILLILSDFSDLTRCSLLNICSSRLLMFPIFLFAAHAVQFGTGQKRPENDSHRKQGCQGTVEQSYLFMIFLILFGWTLLLLDEI